MNRLKHSVLLLALLAPATVALAALPPRYLQVPDFQQCLADEARLSYRAWCMPSKKPRACPAASWKQLRALRHADAVPRCAARRRG